MSEVASFLPEWASPPGATISDFLEDQGRALEDFIRDIGRPQRDARRLLEGTLPITEEIANSLSETLGATTEFWLSRERQFQDAIARQLSSERWLASMPFNDMSRFGWLRPAQSKKDKIDACLEHFGVPTVLEWMSKYEGRERLVAFRTSAAFTSEEGAVLAWLRKGEIEAAKIKCAQWDREMLREALPRLRALTRIKNPQEFIPHLVNICAECGVAAVIERAPKGCRASGATQLLSSNKALLMLSGRYRSDDHFWFTFFHEVGHLILHDMQSLFLEGEDLCSGQQEEEANTFSSNLLIPAESQATMRALPLDKKAVIRFARSIGVSPGIVVGQLQHLGAFTVRQLNDLKVRYSWE